MKFTSEDLMKAMGLNVGDKIKINNKIYTITKSAEGKGAWVGYEDENEWHNLQHLVNGIEYEILPRPKRVGELDCFVEIKCNNCPLRMISGCTNSEGVPLYDILKEIQIDSTKNNMFDQEIHDLLKARLDKEVE